MSIRDLPEEMILHLVKFLGEKECLILALSGASKIFTRLYGESRERLVLARNYSIGTKLWINEWALSITVFDVSHCYWLLEEGLCCCITRMSNLEELVINDTKLSLKNLPRVFEACKKIVKLSFSLTETNLNQYQEGVMEKEALYWMKKGFRQLTKLKLFTFAVEGSFETWLVTFGVLKWCRACINLLIDITYPDEPSEKAKWKEFTELVALGSERMKERSEERKASIAEAIGKAKSELFPHLGWMRSLRSLIILLRQRCSFYEFIDAFFDWLKEGPALDSLERLWITVHNDFRKVITCPSVKSLFMPADKGWWYGLQNHLALRRFWSIEHLGYIDFDYTLDHLSDLKYARGHCKYMSQLDDFIGVHANLEQLIFHLDQQDDFLDRYEDYPVDEVFENGWLDKLILLKVLVYQGCKPSQIAMNFFNEASPNIHQLSMSFTSSLRGTHAIRFLESIRFEHLKWLSIDHDLLNGSYLQSIVQHCPKLERLHLKGNLEAGTFLPHLTGCLPLAINLCDLRLQFQLLQADVSHLSSFLKALPQHSPNLERLVLYITGDDPIHLSSEDFCLIDFVKEMKSLVALCLAGLTIDTAGDAEDVHQQVEKKILPLRPPFWFHLGVKLPANDPSVPRLHYEEVVNPMDAFNSPPPF